MSRKASIAKGVAVGWAVLLTGAFVVFAGVSVLMPSTKSSRIRFEPVDERGAGAPVVAAEVAATQPAR